MLLDDVIAMTTKEEKPVDTSALPEDKPRRMNDYHPEFLKIHGKLDKQTGVK